MTFLNEVRTYDCFLCNESNYSFYSFDPPAQIVMYFNNKALVLSTQKPWRDGLRLKSWRHLWTIPYLAFSKSFKDFHNVSGHANVDEHLLRKLIPR